MKIITLERRTLDGESVGYDPARESGEDYRDWWCVIETEEEQVVYEDFLTYGSKGEDHLWNMMLKHAGLGLGLAWGDDDIYGYIRSDEAAPGIGEEYTDADGDKWVRVE